jgi:hypothetical protein
MLGSGGGEFGLVGGLELCDHRFGAWRPCDAKVLLAQFVHEALLHLGPSGPEEFCADRKLDPELAELLRLEAEERGEAACVASNPQGAGLDPELAELMRLEDQERAANAGALGTDPEVAAEIQRLQAEERGGF